MVEPLIQCIQSVAENAQSARLLAPVVADLVDMYDYLRNVDPLLDVRANPRAWLLKHKDHLISMLCKVQIFYISQADSFVLFNKVNGQI